MDNSTNEIVFSYERVAYLAAFIATPFETRFDKVGLVRSCSVARCDFVCVCTNTISNSHQLSDARSASLHRQVYCFRFMHYFSAKKIFRNGNECIRRRKHE